MSNDSENLLEREIAAFEQRRSDLEKNYPGKFVVFKGDEFIGAWDTLDAAAAQAAQLYGRGPYLIRQVGAPSPTIPASVLFRSTMVA